MQDVALGDIEASLSDQCAFEGGAVKHSAADLTMSEKMREGKRATWMKLGGGKLIVLMRS